MKRIKFDLNNYGIDLGKQKQDESNEDWMFGAVELPDIAPELNGLVVAVYAWGIHINGIYQRVFYAINHCVSMIKLGFEKYLPKGEIQNDKAEKMDCVTRGFNNKIEEKLNYALEKGRLPKETIKFFEDNGYIIDGKFSLNDRIPATLSGTTEKGNSLKAPIDTIRKIGIFPKNIINQYGLTFSQYYNKNDINKEMLNIGLESLKHLSINYLTVNLNNFKDFAGDIKYLIFDNYVDTFDGDYIKRLAEDYNFYYYGYQVIINTLKKKDMAEKFVKIVKKNESNEHGLYIPVISADILKQLSNMFDIDIPLKDNGSVDWEKVKVDGEVAMYINSQDYVEVKGTIWDWFKKFMGL